MPVCIALAKRSAGRRCLTGLDVRHQNSAASVPYDDSATMSNGYSSLGYLARLSVNTLKIDRSFIMTMTSNPDSMMIVSTIISLAHSLNMKVIAEGVETEEQSRFLNLLKSDEIQGYFFSKPLPESQLSEMLEKRRVNLLR